jgi:hypothetical protein
MRVFDATRQMEGSSCRNRAPTSTMAQCTTVMRPTKPMSGARAAKVVPAPLLVAPMVVKKRPISTDPTWDAPGGVVGWV